MVGHLKPRTLKYIVYNDYYYYCMKKLCCIYLSVANLFHKNLLRDWNLSPFSRVKIAKKNITLNYNLQVLNT